jgi:CheY-like chemotaxis protein
VLIVDDNLANRDILKHQTSSWGTIATEAGSGERALELLRAGVAQNKPYDIALLDLMMPDMSGFQLAEAIKTDPTIASVALVILPSYGKRGDGERAWKVGIAAYLPKPVHQSQLHDCLMAVLSRSVSTEPVAPSQLVTRHSLRESEVKERDKTFHDVKILVAEDNLVNQDVVLGQLYNLGYPATAVSNGRELLEALEKDHVDIILMDCQMPEIDGFAATAEIRRREGTGRHTTIIAMTANALNGDDGRCLAAGMDDYLSKPVKYDVLRGSLDRWTRSGNGLSVAGLNEGTVPAEDNKVNVIDLSQLAALKLIRRPGRPHLFRDLIDLFLNEADLDLKALHAALTRDDTVEIQRVAHHLKGSSANIGATQMAALCEKLESRNLAKDARVFLGQLENEFELVREALKLERKETEE